MTELRKWWLNPIDAELSAVHHALRMMTKYPGISEVEAAHYTYLADSVWQLHFVAKNEILFTNHDKMCKCGHSRSKHFMGVYNCGDCPGNDDCVMFRPVVLQECDNS